ncbi:hypothetical protein PRZ48_003907 [Zasmidium cellare]|uniref:AB hydrolase-1 domain-containing protein n=1 Tax=Zasmidium cellare TaxID=395010 RepID=A0ABR0EWR6_ZASCE|nr:hypothetical protein PRZ48_003907 [Zasmidium cellare]
MPELEVPGASLHYQITGQGPLLLTISGANGSYEIWHPLTQFLKDTFTVVSYDRRGFSRSILSGSQDYEHRLDVDADDAAALIKHLSPDQPATVLGSSSGAIVTMRLVQRHSDILKIAVTHEPPAAQLNPDFPEIKKNIESIYDTYRRHGVPPAADQFCDYTMLGEERAGFQRAFDPRSGPYVFSNVNYWFEREFRYPFTEFTPEMFEPYKAKLLPVNAQLTNKKAFHFRANENLTKALGLPLPIFTGGHIGYASHPEEFSKDLLKALKEKQSA